MTFRSYIFFMLVATVLAWTSWVLVLFNVDPRESGLVGFVMFYLTLSISLIGTLALLGVLFRVTVLRHVDVLIREVKISFRHAIILSVLAVISLYASAHGIFKWWVIMLFIVIAALIEGTALTIQKANRG